MRPGRRIWASNGVWAAGPDAGVATKVPMSAGELADGRYRSIRPAPQLDNYELWNLSSRIDNTAALAVRNLISEPVSAAGWPVAWMGIWPDGIYDPTPTRRVHTWIDQAALAGQEYLSRGGRLWAPGVPPLIVAVTLPRLAVNGADVRALALGTAASQMWYSTAYGAWATWPAAGVAGNWQDIDCYQPGTRWVAISIAGLICRSLDPGVSAFTAPAVGPGFAAPAVVSVAHTQHAPGDLYPTDPGNDTWLALTDTQCSISVDAGNNWTAALAHGLASSPGDVAYSKIGGQWIAVDFGRGICRSVDGLVWTRSAPGTVGGLFAAAGPTVVRIATDGFGHWAVFLLNQVAGTYEVHTSFDDGATWREVFPDYVVPNAAHGCLWYGDGAFHVMTTDSIAPASLGAVYSTFRTVD